MHLPRSSARATLASLLAAALLAACTSGSDEDAPTGTATPTAGTSASATEPASDATAVLSPTPEPTVKPSELTSTPTPELKLDVNAIFEPSDRIERVIFAGGEEPSGEHGVFYTDVATGETELWRIADLVGFVGYSVDRGGRFFTAVGPDVSEPQARLIENRRALVDRDEAEAFELGDSVELLISPGRHGYGVIGIGDDERWLLDFNGPGVRALARIDVYLWPGAQVFLSPDGRYLYLEGRSLNRFDLESGEETSIGRGRLFPHLEGFDLINSDEGSRESFGWDGSLVSEEAFPAGRIGSLGPDRRTMVSGYWLPLGVPDGLGGSEQWPVLVFSDLNSGTDLLRVQRASSCGGQGWLGDGSEYLASTPNGFSIIRPRDGSIEAVRFAAPGDRLGRSPRDPDLFLHNGDVVDRSGVVLQRAFFARSWVEDGTEVFFARSIDRGRDFGACGASAGGLPTRIEYPPFSDEVRLRVTGKISHLNLRAAPLTAGRRIAELPEGSEVIVTDDETEIARKYCNGSRACSVTWDPDLPYGERWWLHVRTEDGIEGWAASEYLDWAD